MQMRSELSLCNQRVVGGLEKQGNISFLVEVGLFDAATTIVAPKLLPSVVTLTEATVKGRHYFSCFFNVMWAIDV